MAGGAKKVTKRGLGKTGNASVRGSGALSCPPPSSDAKTKRRASLVVGQPSETLRRYSSSPTAVNADDLAVVVRVTPTSKPKMTHAKNLSKASR